MAHLRSPPDELDGQGVGALYNISKSFKDRNKVTVNSNLVKIL